MTRAQTILLPAALLLLGACTEPGNNQGPATIASTLPESVRAIADPGQDLTTAFFKVEDGCYWYRYSGPVEVTELPLRSTGGAPICTRPREQTQIPATG